MRRPRDRAPVRPQRDRGRPPTARVPARPPGGPAGAVLEAAVQPRPRRSRGSTRPHPTPTSPARATTGSAPRRTGPPGRSPAPGDTAAVTVPADPAWTSTGLYLELGTHQFTATGRWSSAGRSCGPEGDT